MHDKAYWQTILENKGALPNDATLDDLTAELLPFLRDPDPVLRDEFGYQILAHWIMSGHYDTVQLQSFLARWCDDLTMGIDQVGDERLLQRSFAALMLSILVYYDLKHAWMSVEDFSKVTEATLAYLLAEKDLRDYDSQVGWYHATAHTADVLKFLARNDKSDADVHQRILDSIAIKLTMPEQHIYTHGEPDRLALAVLDVVKRGTLNDAHYQVWLDRLVAVKEGLKPAIELDEPAYGAVQNVTAFLRALHITLAKNRETLAENAAVEYLVFERLLAL